MSESSQLPQAPMKHQLQHGLPAQNTYWGPFCTSDGAFLKLTTLKQAHTHRPFHPPGELWLNVFLSLRAETSAGCSSCMLCGEGRDAGSGQFDIRRLGITPFPSPKPLARAMARKHLSLARLQVVCLRKKGQRR